MCVGLVLAQSVGRQPPPSPAFNRDVDGTVVVVVASKLCGLEAVRSSLAPFQRELNFEESEYQLRALGPLPARRFVVAFGGSAGLASREVGK
eukprot:342749-Pyramimonas_sp.AAC.1